MPEPMPALLCSLVVARAGRCGSRHLAATLTVTGRRCGQCGRGSRLEPAMAASLLLSARTEPWVVGGRAGGRPRDVV